MKKYLFILLVALATCTLISCEKEEPETKHTNHHRGGDVKSSGWISLPKDDKHKNDVALNELISFTLQEITLVS